jgi:hypothetical protein
LILTVESLKRIYALMLPGAKFILEMSGWSHDQQIRGFGVGDGLNDLNSVMLQIALDILAVMFSIRIAGRK